MISLVKSKYYLDRECRHNRSCSMCIQELKVKNMTNTLIRLVGTVAVLFLK